RGLLPALGRDAHRVGLATVCLGGAQEARRDERLGGLVALLARPRGRTERNDQAEREGRQDRRPALAAAPERVRARPRLALAAAPERARAHVPPTTSAP